MKNARITLSLLLAVTALIVGCQTPNSPSADPIVTGRPETDAPAPAMPPAAVAVPQPSSEPKGEEAAGVVAPVSMSVNEMQQRLSELGYKPGVADGKMGPRTTNALKKFQHDRKLAVTGTLDAETMRELHKR